MADAQRRAALERANAARGRIRDGRRRLATGELAIDDVLADPPRDAVDAQLQRLEVARVLDWLPGVGPPTAGRILDAARVLPSVRVVALTAAQRTAVRRATDVYRPERP
jgi:hypothetical protein